MLNAPDVTLAFPDAAEPVALVSKTDAVAAPEYWATIIQRNPTDPAMLAVTMFPAWPVMFCAYQISSWSPAASLRPVTLAYVFVGESVTELTATLLGFEYRIPTTMRLPDVWSTAAQGIVLADPLLKNSAALTKASAI